MFWGDLLKDTAPGFPVAPTEKAAKIFWLVMPVCLALFSEVGIREWTEALLLGLDRS